MSSSYHKKLKQRLALAFRIESKNKRANPCSNCFTRSRQCFLDKEQSARCSECVRSKRACDTNGYLVVPQTKLWSSKPVCRFFIPRRPVHPSTPPRSPSPPAIMEPDPSAWFPSFDFEMFLDQFGANPDDPLLGLDFGDGTPQPSQGS